MKELTVGKNDAGQRLDRFVAKAVPLLPDSLLQKYIRLKRIKVNGKPSKRDLRLSAGDVLMLYMRNHVSIFSMRMRIFFWPTRNPVCSATVPENGITTP